MRPATSPARKSGLTAASRCCGDNCAEDTKVCYHRLMHILHITPYYAPAYAFGGVVRAVEGMARALVERGHSVTVLTTDALSPRQRCDGHEELRDGVKVVRVPNLLPRSTLNLSTPRRMAHIARTLIAQADAVHCHEFRTVENLLVTPAARALGKPLLLSPHGTLPLEPGR